jgi:hypothetical protein
MTRSGSPDFPGRDVHLATADGGNWNDRIDQVSVC